MTPKTTGTATAVKTVKKWAKKVRASRRKWTWGRTAKLGDYVAECSYLPDTLISTAGTWEGGAEDCAYVSAACEHAPALAKACGVLQAKLDEAMRENAALRWYVGADIGEVFSLYNEAHKKG